ncbi:MAG: histidine--tRNA ligase [Ruminococcaceae bacterium]|nr:histidine--tRNA ligase [Oscillospiraceae bacterium]
MQIKAPRGTHDVLPQESYKWHKIESTIKELCQDFDYKEIRTPVFEHTELFERGVGETTDVVQKEMYTFLDKGDRSITLRPEGTASVVRSLVEHSIYAQPLPAKLYYVTPCFRYEKPQAGRLRAFHQFGVEVFGAEDAALDAEIISLALELFRRLGVTGVELEINSIGCPECRKAYNQKLRDYFKPHLNDLCETCRQRYEKNPLRILDCKQQSCKDIYNSAPILLDNICPDCESHFERLKACLDVMGIPYTVDGTIVRGLDYYTRTVFEIVSKNIGAQGTVCGGGRYNGLVSELGGPELPAVGFGLGMERLLLLLENLEIDLGGVDAADLYIGHIGERADLYVQKLVLDLRRQGVSVCRDYMNRSVKAQMKYADKIGAKYTMVLGDNEIDEGLAKLKNMETGDTTEVKLDTLGDFFKQLGGVE